MRRLGMIASLALACVAFTSIAAQNPTPTDPRIWANEIWQAAKAGKADQFENLLKVDADAADTNGLFAAARRLDEHANAREAARKVRMDELRKEFVEFTTPGEKANLTKALKAATELSIITTSKEALLAEPGVRDLVAKAQTAAHDAEARGELLEASELFILLNALYEESAVYKKDSERVNQRLIMLRLYAPERLWEMRDARQKALGEKPLPAYNALGDNWRTKLETITQVLVERAMGYAEQHVEQTGRTPMLVGGLESVRTMITTPDLRHAFPSLADDAAREAMLKFIDEQIAKLGDGRNDALRTSWLLDRLRETNDRTVKIPSEALLHEFGNGAMSRLDEFSSIIWPDEVRRFQRTTQGRFVGVGIQLEYDERMNVRVVTPIEGTPAHRAGVRPGDVITKVDHKVIFGLSLDQAIELITGPAGTQVVLTMDRKVDDKDTKEIDIPITRGVINVITARGWKRTGQREDDWNWYVDEASRIGYVRLSQFTETTADELARAAASLKQSGLNGLVLDLRFNPGGLLDQAVKVSRRFVSVPGGRIVGMKGAGGQVEQPELSRPNQATLANVPIVVLINEGSASASEIVSGALRHYADNGSLDAVLLGQRSYGKGSVQNVWPLTGNAMMKVTIQYYTLPDGQIIHRRPGAAAWGVPPHIAVEMLPKQTEEAILKRRDADVLPEMQGQAGVVRTDPDELLTHGVDLQLESAVLLLKARASIAAGQANSVK